MKTWFQAFAFFTRCQLVPLYGSELLKYRKKREISESLASPAAVAAMSCKTTAPCHKTSAHGGAVQVESSRPMASKRLVSTLEQRLASTL
jgi:hypothetical protein